MGQHGVHRFAAADGGLELLAALGFVVEQRPLVGDAALVGVHPIRNGFAANAQRLVGFGELPVRCIVVGVFLNDRAPSVRVEGLESRPDGLEVGRDFHFDFVHGRGHERRP